MQIMQDEMAQNVKSMKVNLQLVSKMVNDLNKRNPEKDPFFKQFSGQQSFI